jgi:uncharacterized membrane protein YfcA
MLSDPWFYAAAVPAMIVLGLSKGGFGVINLLTVPILALAISPVQAAGITLPILVLSDIVALAAYWRRWDTRLLAAMLPGALLGIIVGWLAAAWVTEQEIRLIVGVVSIAFAVDYFLRHRRSVLPRERNWPKALFWSTVTGFTSFVSHAGGPPYQVYTAPLRLDPRTFAATSVIFFAILNAVKLVPYFFLGQFNPENLATSAILLPISIPATLLGVWLVKRVNTRVFYEVTYGLILIVGLFLVGESVGELAGP